MPVTEGIGLTQGAGTDHVQRRREIYAKAIDGGLSKEKALEQVSAYNKSIAAPPPASSGSVNQTPTPKSGVEDPNVENRRAIYAGTVDDGYSKEDALKRVHEYNYGVKQGLNPQRASEFSYTLQLKQAEKKALSDEEKRGIASQAWERIQQAKEAHDTFLKTGQKPSQEQTELLARAGFGNPEKQKQYAEQWANHYAEARARGWDDQKANEYANGGGILGRGWMKFTDALYDALPAKAQGALDWSGRERGQSENAARANEFRNYRDVSELDKKYGRTMGSIDLHIRHLLESFTNPQMAAIEAASMGTGVLERGGFATLSEAGEAGVAQRGVNTAMRSIGKAAGRGLAAQGEGEEGLKAAESAENALKAIREARVPVSVQSTTRNIQRLAHAGFAAQMMQGTSESFEAAHEQMKKGDTGEAIGYAIEGLVNGLMVAGSLHHMQAQAKLRGDLDTMTAKVYGDESRFGKLNDQQQAVVINQLIEDDPNYKVAADASEKDIRKAATKLNHRYNDAVQQAWNPNAVTRGIVALRAERAETARTDAVKQVVARLKEQVDKRTREIAEQEEKKRQGIEAEKQAGRDSREERKAQEAHQRETRKTVASTLQTDRQAIWGQRQQALKARQDNYAGPTRDVPVEVDDTGHQSYPADVWGETQRFGVVSDGDRHGIYRDTPRGRQWLERNGEFSEEPESLYYSADPQAADTMARISSLVFNADTLAEQPDATDGQKNEAAELREIRRQALDGEITPKEAQKKAGIAPQAQLPTEFMAGMEGRINGPYHESSRGEYAAEMERQLREAGADDAEIQATLEAVPEMAWTQTVAVLNHVYRPGDYIVSKRGVKWTLDSKGLLHPDDGGSPVPLIKRGEYSNQAVQLASTGRVGYGTKTRAERMADRAKRREVAAAVGERREEIRREMLLAMQNEGLQPASEYGPAAERADEGEKAERRKKFLSRPPVAPEVQKIRAIGRMIYSAGALSPDGVIQSVARAKAVTPEEVMREALATDPERADTPEAKVARLQAGDRISDPFRKDRPWVVTESKSGSLELRSGQANPIPLDRVNPSERVKQIIQRGTITSDTPEFTEADVAKAAQAPHVIHRDQLVQEVKDRAEGKVQDPEPKTPEEAEKQSDEAEQRKAAVVEKAVEEADKASNPPTDKPMSPDEAVAQADELARQAEQAKKLAEEGYRQAAAAKGKAVAASKPGDYPQKAPISSQTVPGRGWAIGVPTIILANGENFPARYELVQPSELTVSFVWNGNNLERNPSFPEQMQPALPDEKTRQEILSQSQPGTYQIIRYLDPGRSAEQGPAVVEQGGDVAGGNRRLLRLLKHLELIGGDREAMADLVNQVKAFASQHGMAYPDDGKLYIPVRMMDERIGTIERATQLGKLFNEGASSKVDNMAMAIANGRLLYEAQSREQGGGHVGVLETIANRFNDAETPREAMQEDPQYFVHVVKDYLHVGPETAADWFIKDRNHNWVLSGNGKENLELALLSTVIKNPTALEALKNGAAYPALLKAIGPLSRLRAIPEKDITPIIEEAVSAAADTERKKVDQDTPEERWNKAYLIQDMFSDAPPPPEPQRMVEAIWRAMHDRKPTRLKMALNDYLVGEGRQRGMFGEEEAADKTPAELFNEAFEPELKEVRDARRKRDKEYNDLSEGRREYLDKHPWQMSEEDFNAAREHRDIEVEPAAAEPSGTQSETKPLEKPATEVHATAPETNPKIGPPPTAGKSPEQFLQDVKAAKGYVNAQELMEFLQKNPATKEHAEEIYRTAKMMAEHVWKYDHPDEVTKKDALDWVLKERVARIEAGDSETARGEYNDPNLEKGIGAGILRLHKAADASTFIHEFAHVVFPLLSNEDLKLIDDIGEKRVWDGKTLKGEAYKSLSEKFAHGLEQFLRDARPTGFKSGGLTKGVAEVFAKVKDMMREVYLRFKRDPLSPFHNTPDSMQVFADMFHITEFDNSENWREVVKEARKKEAKEVEGTIFDQDESARLAREMGAKGAAKRMPGSVEDSIGDRVDPRKAIINLVFDSQEAATAAALQLTGGGKVDGAEIIKGVTGKWGVKINVPEDKGKLMQELPERHPGLQLEDLEKRLKAIPSFKIMERKLLQVQIDNLKNRIRADYGVEDREPKSAPEVAKAAVKEATRGTDTNGVRKGTDGVLGFPNPKATGGLPKPPQFGMPRNAAAGPRGSAKPAGRLPASLSEVAPVNLQPIAGDRGTPVGTTAEDKFDAKEWTEGLKKAGLPENAPPPTVPLSRGVADKLRFPGQKQVVQLALSALQQGDGMVIASATGSGKTYTSTAVIKEFQKDRPNARILYVSKNRKLLKKTKGVAEGTFGFGMELEAPKDHAQTGVWGVSYMGMMQDSIYKQMKWDLVVADESGEARNWFQDANKQGKLLIDVIRNSGKAVYLSATPFHSPAEYGYLEKLKLWPQGMFDKWIADNFAHETTNDGKVIARLDPGKQAKLRQQLIERGQLISQAISYDGFTAHFGVVPISDSMKRGLDRIREGFARARAEFLKKGKKGLAEKTAAFEAVYTKSFLERERLPQAIELARKARSQGWQVGIFSEHSAEDLFRRERDEEGNRSTYQELDDGMDGQLSKIIPPFPDVYRTLREEFGSQIGDYSGRGNTQAERDKALTDFLKGETPMLYTTYAAGGIGLDMHDADFPDLGIKGGDKPRVFVFLGPPYSGVLLEQAMGRGWRFGVKSNVHAVFLASDAEPDVRLMQTKVGPRMKALRAAVLGERDSLASAMDAYTDEEKIKARQDALAYAEGNEQKVTAKDFQVRSKNRNVGIDDWSHIEFPHADTAKNKGMKYGEEVTGGSDWSTLFQKLNALYEPPSPEVERAKDTIDAIATGAATGQGLPRDAPLQNLDPADRDVVVGAASAVAAGEAEIPVDRDKTAAARQSMQAQLNLPGNRDAWVLTFPDGPGKGVWKYTGNPEDLTPVDGKDRPELPKNVKTWYIGNEFSQEIGIRQIARQAKAAEAGDNIVRMGRAFQTDKDHVWSQLALLGTDIMSSNKLDPRDPKVMNELWQVVEGRWNSADPAIEKAASDLRSVMEMANDLLAEASVKVKTPGGEYVEFSKKTRDPYYMPHRIDWDAQVEDPFTGDKHTLREIMGRTFAEDKRARIIAALAEQSGGTPQEVEDYLDRHRPGTPVLGHVHRARTFNFPIVKRDWPTLLGYFDQVAEAIAIEKNFGQDRVKLNAEITKIPSRNGRKTIHAMFDSMLEPQEWTGITGKFYNAMIGYEAASKMTLSFAKVPYHLVHTGLVLSRARGGVRAVFRGGIETALHPKRVMEEATYVGTVARQLNVGDLIGDAQQHSLAHEVFRRYMFQAFYKWGRAIAGNSARVFMEQYAMNDLKRGGAAAEHTRRLLRDVMLVGDKAIDEAVSNGRWSPEDLARSQTAFTNLTMFSDNPLQMPKWARLDARKEGDTSSIALARAIRLTYALQSFALKTTSLVREHLWDEVVHHGNMRPIAYFAIAYPIVGEMLRATGAGVKGTVQGGISGARKKLTGKGEVKHDAWDKYFADFKDFEKHPVAAALQRYIDDITFAIAWDRTRRLSDPLFDWVEGKKNKSANYILEDEVEQDIGAAWSSLVMQPIKLAKTEYQIARGTKASPHEKHEHEEKTLVKFLTDEWPISKEIPALQDWIHQQKKKHSSAPLF